MMIEMRVEVGRDTRSPSYFYSLYTQEIRLEIHEGFDNTTGAVRSQAEETREGVEVRRSS